MRAKLQDAHEPALADCLLLLDQWLVSGAHDNFRSLHETLLNMSALILGELLAHPIELVRRRTYALHNADDAVAPDASQLSSVHPLTLHFADPRLESLYATGVSAVVAIAFTIRPKTMAHQSKRE